MDSSNQLSDQRNKRRRLRFILQIAISAALGGFLFGYDTAVINGAVGAIGAAFTVSKQTLGFAVASALLGAALGAFKMFPTSMPGLFRQRSVPRSPSRCRFDRTGQCQLELRHS
ncbi:MAG: hypothetical protein VYE46_06370 [Cyanobacteriota bacterium]|nr:hypothetical protein [Cyanobacteriota bacterium]